MDSVLQAYVVLDWAWVRREGVNFLSKWRDLKFRLLLIGQGSGNYLQEGFFLKMKAHDAQGRHIA